MTNPIWIVELKQDENSNDIYFELPLTIVNQLGLFAGDELRVVESNFDEIHLVKK